MGLNMYSRICIFGRPGSGKSTFALKLSQKTGLPLYHLDKYFFTANWVERDYQEFLAIQQNIVNQERWIVDGNSLKSLEMRYSRAQIVLYFNYSKWVCLFRLIKRKLFKDKNIKDRAEGCKENIRWSLIKYMWTFETRLNNRLTHQLKEFKIKYPKVKFIEMRDNRDMEKINELFGLNKK